MHFSGPRLRKLMRHALIFETDFIDKGNDLMIHAVAKFFLPYTEFLLGSAYNLHQVFEGIGYSTSSFPVTNSDGVIVQSYWSPQEGMLPFLGALLMLTASLQPVVAMAAYTLGRAKGVLVYALLLLLPGVLSLLDIFPRLRYIPESFAIDSPGTLGSETGVVPLLVIAATAGWAITVLLYDNFRLTERFRQYYDHFWFPTALVAAIFFVADNGANENLSQLIELSQNTRNSSQYLLGQIRRYQEYCKANGLEATKSCQWSSYSQWTIGSLSQYPPELFVDLVPADSGQFYQKPSQHELSSDDILDLRKELAAYNQRLCPVVQLGAGFSRNSPLSSTCESPPTRFCNAWPDGPEEVAERYIAARPVAIASECIIPSLIAAKPKLQKLLEKAKAGKEAKNYRWLYFMAVAVAVGGKTANSSTKLAEIDSRPVAQRRILVRGVLRFIGWLVSWGWRMTIFATRVIRSAITKIPRPK
ncbi:MULTISPECIES: hypothetical protein [Pseudomonas syringae group]|uniref:hypothetical protein n=1 Tax=Pseudomonas syringae group TaxID=136849 RepID=UPI0006D5D2D3|nr:hypothetical protein [Pseudomonas coronafaciens]